MVNNVRIISKKYCGDKKDSCAAVVSTLRYERPHVPRRSGAFDYHGICR